MEAIVLRVRLISGDSMDVTYEDRDASSEDEAIDTSSPHWLRIPGCCAADTATGSWSSTQGV
jgi:hypothetical protein